MTWQQQELAWALPPTFSPSLTVHGAHKTVSWASNSLCAAHSSKKTSAAVQEITLLLHGQLDSRPAFANALLCTQLPVFLQQPVAMEQLLRAVPQTESCQALLYRSLCQCIAPGMALHSWHEAPLVTSKFCLGVSSFPPCI